MGGNRSAVPTPEKVVTIKESPRNDDNTVEILTKVLRKIHNDDTRSNAPYKLVSLLQEKLNNVAPLMRRASIFKVPITLRKVNEEAYTPQVISIGPYHHGINRLKSMEEHKLRYLADFFCRRQNFSLEDFVKGMKELEKDARQCYGPIVKDETDAFVEMMILDGCFIVELFIKHFERNIVKDVLEKDPLFHIASMIPAIRVDMLLLENQLPLFVLQFIYTLFSNNNAQWAAKISFLELALRFFNFKYLLSGTQDAYLAGCEREVDHFLDVMRECYLSPGTLIISKRAINHKVIPSATELRKAGVKFRRATTNNIFQLHFTRGVLEMPALLLQDSTEVLFRNLIAFEQCSINGEKQFITHYLALMDFLINSSDDVATLRRAGIIDNWLGDDEQVSQLFNKIFTGVTIFAGNFYFKKVTEEVNTYYNTPWHSFRAMLGRDYFYSPWSTASSFAVIIVVLCTIVQAVGSVFSMVKEKESGGEF